jgi:hypothetical protein
MAGKKMGHAFPDSKYEPIERFPQYFEFPYYRLIKIQRCPCGVTRVVIKNKWNQVQSTWYLNNVRHGHPLRCVLD